ncbi:DUF3592 domain-containing protein [Pseudoduganella sp. FT25W]|jgi:hypothetical protein|uniref:DUF3592 domain-containing protein n=1 Tax=Duganella alba TaxID=2666081 RepID=A0A6L5QKU3_9BURK|nr:DUF3592 domain-containing protein [Duganella alba]MRX10330.1 DUF3592 domain-containing protein [Duganella alba]MRX20044.1 DUF3592 domain-containing protein [Duganella alba]
MSQTQGAVKTPPDPALEQAFAWCLVLTALVAGYFTFARAWDKLASPHWPEAQAEVLRSSMYQRTGRARDWCLKLSYQYQVGGQVYQSSAMGVSRIGDAGCHREQAVTERRLQRLRPGALMTISYKPRAPETAAAFIIGLDPLDYGMSAIVLIVFGGGVRALRRLRKLSTL